MDKKKIKALLQAVEDDKLNHVAKLLTENPGLINIPGYGKQTYSAKTPLMFALQCSNCKISKFLLEHGADVNAVMDENWKWPVLHFAVRAAVSSVGKPEHIEMVKDLIARGANPNAKDAFGNTSLDRAVLDYDKNSDHWQVIQLLLDAGADISNFNPNTQMTIRDVVIHNAHLYSDKVLELMKH